MLVGQNLRLYEYGPAYLRLHEPYVENTIRVRALSIGRLDYGDLLMCRELLNRIWI